MPELAAAPLPDRRAGEADVTRIPELSCFTTNLAAYLEPAVPDIRGRFATATRLAVRVDHPDLELEFSHHDRVDRQDGWELGYASAAEWPEAKSALAEELDRAGMVLAVANLACLPWAPGRQAAAAAHWVLLCAHHRSRWLLADHFAALTPHGEQRPFRGWLDDAELAAVLTPLPKPSPLDASRDRMALGEEVALPGRGGYRWLARRPRAATAAPGPGSGPRAWLLDPAAALSRTADVLTTDPAAAARYADDVWTASRHHVHRLTVLAARGPTDSDLAAANRAAWEELPQHVRFAALSADRGRPRTSLIRMAFDQVIATSLAASDTSESRTP